MDNRRNYYRLLHVQADAPIAVISASYRTLMGTMRHHPDLGGDTARAVLLNQAYAVLKDPQRRCRYDAMLAPPGGRGIVDATAVGDTRPHPMPRQGSAYGAAGHGCPVCRASLPARITFDSRCVRCDAPLAAPAPPAKSESNVSERRGSPRSRLVDQGVTLSIGWPARRHAARCHDLSRTGLSIATPQRLLPQQIVRIVAPALDIVAEVVACAPCANEFTVRARVVTVVFTRSTGVFVSAKA